MEVDDPAGEGTEKVGERLSFLHLSICAPKNEKEKLVNLHLDIIHTTVKQGAGN